MQLILTEGPVSFQIVYLQMKDSKSIMDLEEYKYLSGHDRVFPYNNFQVIPKIDKQWKKLFIRTKGDEITQDEHKNKRYLMQKIRRKQYK